MILTVSSREIGSRQNLIFDGTSWSWSSDIPENSLLWGFDRPSDLKDAAQSLGLNIQTFWDTPWGKAQSQIQSTKGCVLWQYVMPFAMWKSHIENLVNQLWINFTDEDNSYYVKTHLRNRRIIWQLSRPTVSRQLYQQAASGKSINLEKLKPDHSGKIGRSKYSFSKTVTGRMTITDGPNILTLKKESRRIFQSQHPGGKIVEIDLQSAEPRVALSLFGKSVQGDIYEHVSSSLNLDIDRKTAKVATISALYGASQHALREQLGCNSNAIKVLESVKEYFGVHHIEKMIQAQHEKLSYISNTHGRKIFSDAPSVNHFVQSSTVDVAFDVFESLLEKIKDMKIEAVPLYIIHDAIVLDVSAEGFVKLADLCKDGFESKTIRTNFPVRIKEIK